MTTDLLLTVAILVAGFALLYGELRRIRLEVEAAADVMHRLADELAEFNEEEFDVYDEEFDEVYR